MDHHRTKARIISYLLIVVVLVHTAIVALWAGPSNPIKDAVGPQRVREYVNPVFEQNWNIFAPTPKRVMTDLDFRLRVKDRESGAIITTPWHALVEAENAMIRHNPAPPRTAFAARRTSLTLHNAVGDMNEDQKSIIQQDFDAADSRQNLADSLRNAPTKSGANAAKISSFLRYDEMATALATMSGAVLYEGQILAIQYRTSKRGVPKFADRAHRSVADMKKTIHDFGWRQPAVVTKVQIEHFAPYAKSIPLAEDQGA